MRLRILIPLACLALAACATIAPPSPAPVTGARTAQREFAAPMSRVRVAAVSALGSRSMRIVALGAIPDGETIRARGQGGAAELQLVRSGPRGTRMTATVDGEGASAAALLEDVARFLESAAR